MGGSMMTKKECCDQFDRLISEINVNDTQQLAEFHKFIHENYTLLRDHLKYVRLRYHSPAEIMRIDPWSSSLSDEYFAFVRGIFLMMSYRMIREKYPDATIEEIEMILKLEE